MHRNTEEPYTSQLTVHGHFINLGAVVLLNVSQDPDVVILHKVDSHTPPPVPTRAPNPIGDTYNTK